MRRCGRKASRIAWGHSRFQQTHVRAPTMPLLCPFHAPTPPSPPPPHAHLHTDRMPPPDDTTRCHRPCHHRRRYHCPHMLPVLAPCHLLQLTAIPLMPDSQQPQTVCLTDPVTTFWHGQSSRRTLGRASPRRAGVLRAPASLCCS